MNDEPRGNGNRVVIVGGGVAGIEALLALHDLAGDRAELTLVAPQPDFLNVEVAVPMEWHEEPMALDPYRPPDVG
jgi:NADPH-dependent 2,4-dienoyl-CoA reductase/sulfur reductase-like enzyme